MVVSIRGRAYCNVQVYRLKRDRGRIVERKLIDRRHNLVTTAGLNQIRNACNGTAWHLSGFGLGDDGTAPAASDTWGRSELICAAPTTSSYKGNRYRMSYLVEEDDLVGETLREAWIAPGIVVGSGSCYARVVIDDIVKTAEYAYLFLFDCTWTGCTDKACSMLAAQAASGGAYSFKLDECLFGSGTLAESTSDTTLELPWVMSRLALASSTATVDGELTLAFTIPPDTYVGNWAREMGVYATVESGTFPLSEPLMFVRNLIAAPYEVVPDEGATAVCVITWEAE